MKIKNSLINGLFTLALLAMVTSASAQTFSQGEIVIDVLAGGPNVSKVFVGDGSTLFEDGTDKVTGMMPIGARGEYLVSDKFGIGLEFTYASGKRVYDYTEGGENYITTWKHNKLRILPTFNYHFLDNETVDLYMSFGVGMKSVNYTWESTNENDLDAIDIPTGKISSKFAIGTRIFFTENIL